MQQASATQTSALHAIVMQANADVLLRSVSIGALCAVTWALSHSYGGIVHDAGQYTLQALAHLSPESLARDVFLSHGSQDSYSIFGYVYAAAIRLLGVESAAAVLTLVSQLAVIACAWQLARNLMPASLALLAVSIVIAVPGIYGPDRIFTCIEPFLTPRMIAEALVLGSLCAFSCARMRLALGLLAAAALIHPIMAAAGIAALLWKYIGIPHPRLAVLLIGATTIALTTLSYALPAGGWGRFDAVWLGLIQDRSPYLFLSHWALDDWVRAVVPLATLTVGMGVLPDERARSLSRIVLLTAISGLVLTLVACDLLHLVFFTQLQPWRWLWLSTVAAALLLPAVVHTAWQAGFAGRTTVLLLISSWLFGSDILALEIALAAVASVVVMRHLRQSEARLVFLGACGLFAIAAVWRIASNLAFTDAHYYDPAIALWLRRAMSCARDGTFPVAVAVLVWWLAESVRRRPATIAVAVLATLTCLCIAPETWSRWTRREFPASLTNQFTAWRALIPPGVDVFWPGEPLATWLFLERPSYLSAVQTVGFVFSRPAALEMARRANSLGAGVPPQTFLGWEAEAPAVGLAPRQLQLACATSQFQYLVTGAKLDRAPLAQLSRETWPVSGGLRLYSCGKRTG